MEATTTHAPPAAIHRPRQGRAFAGVAAAIAARTGVGVGWIRAAFVIAAFIGGAGILAYLVGWLTIPNEGERLSIAGQMLAPLESRGGARMVGIVLLGIAALVALAAVDVLSARWILIGGLAVFGVLLYRGEVLSGSPPPPAPPPLPPVAAGTEIEGAVATVAAPGATAPPAAARPPRSPVGRLTVAAMFVAVGIVAALAVTDAVSVRPVYFAAAALAVVGVGLVVGAFMGGGRWLAVVGVILLPFVLVLSAVPTTWSSEVGDRRLAPVVAGDDFRLGAGTLRLDLTGLDSTSAPVVAEVGAGDLRVTLPAGRGAVVEAEVGVGELRIAGVVHRGGIGLDEERTFPGPDPIHLQAATGFGRLSIEWEDR